MLINKKHPDINLKLLLLSIVYLIACCCVFFLIASIVIDVVFNDKVNVTREVIIDIIVVTIAGIAGSEGAWIFAKIDERKTRKSQPSDPD
ncbi:hypothetical protein FZN28_25630 [Escherichia coli]|uniref:hypothetical protein n=1 Tax=Escherichia coli TaxID=562 RepID=UPI001369BFDB|nr:hypothetical protein [Escherichia coli]NAQ12257.1 hypothetical protein [Escherichia coli]